MSRSGLPSGPSAVAAANTAGQAAENVTVHAQAA
jgi:hypothetical protein